MRFLAVDWSNTECRYLLASLQRGGGITVQKTGLAAIEDVSAKKDRISDSEKTSKSNELLNLITVLRNILKEERIGSCSLLLCLDRNKIELLYQTLPPCSEQEIPILLKNQVLRELSGFSEHDPLDYLVLGNTTEENHRILAATIPLSYRQSLVHSFRSISCSPQRIGLKSLAVAELMFHSEAVPKDFEPGLVVHVVENEVDLVLVEGKQILSVRSVRLPDQLRFSDIVEKVAAEIERTVMISDDHVIGQPIKKIILFGTDEDWIPLVQVLTEQNLDVSVINPFQISGVHAAAIPDQPGCFAPLLGLLFEQQTPSKNTIDFLHTKEAPKPTNYFRSVFLAILLLGICCFGFYYWNREVVRSMEEELIRVKEEHQKVVAQLQQIQPGFNVLYQTKNWDSQNVVWLDELRELSLVLPNEQDLVVSQMSFSILENNTRFSGMIQMNGIVRDPSVLLKLQTDLQRQGVYLVQFPVPSVNPAGGGYPWLFRVSIYRLRR
ncbi:MAG: hypothetical protein LBC20_03660 [Planctomycetaceae bacterium]|jgi:hypothetical protein|nr:hypothetical protein [Planctomycetaceae bacterium]